MPASSLTGRARAAAAWSKVWPALVFALVVVAFAPRALAGQAVLAPVDMLEPVSPYREVIERPPHVTSIVQTDQIEGLPNAVSFFGDLRDGQVQLYTPAIAGGSATGTMPLWGLWSPFSVGYLVLPAWYAPAVRVALALFASMGFMYLFLRQLRLGKHACVLGAIAFTFNATNLVLVNRIMAVFVLPAILWAVARALRRPTPAAIAIVAVCTAWLWMEGFPSGFFYAVYLAVAFVVWIVADRLRVRWRQRHSAGATPDLHADPVDAVPDEPGVGGGGGGGGGSNRDRIRYLAHTPIGTGALIAGGLVWGIGLAAMTLLPFAKELLGSGALSRRVYDSTAHLPPLQVFSLVTLEAGGTPVPESWWTSVNPVEGGSMVGLIVLVGAGSAMVASAFGRVRVRSREAAVAWNLFGLLTPTLTIAVFLGTPILSILYKVPGIAQGPVNRIRYLIAFGLVVMAAIGFDSLVERATDGGGWRRVSRWAGPVCLAGILAVMVSAWSSFRALAEQMGAGDVVRRSVIVGLALATVAVGAALFARQVPRARAVTMAVIAALLFAQLAYPMRQFTPASPKEDFFPVTDSHRELQALTDRGDRYRFASTAFNFYPNSAMVTDLSDLRGLTVAPTDFRDLVLAANPSAFDRDPLKLILLRDEWNLTSPAYDELALGYFALGEYELPYGRLNIVDDHWTDWRAGEAVASATLPPAGGELAGVFVPVRFGGPECSRGHVTVTVTDRNGQSASAWRPSTDAEGQRIGFALAGAALDANGPLTMRVAYDGSGSCTMSVGTVADTARGVDAVRPAVQWIVDDPADGVHLVSTKGAWIYERPTAQPLVTAHAGWATVPDRAAATARVITRPAGEPYEAFLTGEVPEWVHRDQAGAATVRDVVVGDGRVDLTVDATGTALVAYRENFSSDWVVRVDGEAQPVQQLNGAQLAVFVAAGTHDVSFTYEPKAFWMGLSLSLVSGAAVVAVLVWTVGTGRRRRRSDAEALRH